MASTKKQVAHGLLGDILNPITKALSLSSSSRVFSGLVGRLESDAIAMWYIGLVTV